MTYKGAVGSLLPKETLVFSRVGIKDDDDHIVGSNQRMSTCLLCFVRLGFAVCPWLAWNST